MIQWEWVFNALLPYQTHSKKLNEYFIVLFYFNSYIIFSILTIISTATIITAIYCP